MRRFAEPPGDGEDFYVGYLSPAPPGISEFVRRAVLALALVSVVLAFGLTALQSEFDSGYFDFGNVTEHTGALDLQPVPRLLPADGSEPRLLVAVGKFGVDAEGFTSGQPVTVRATAIDAPAGHMLEVVQIGAASQTPRVASDLEEGEPTSTELIGEGRRLEVFPGRYEAGTWKDTPRVRVVMHSRWYSSRPICRRRRADSLRAGRS